MIKLTESELHNIVKKSINKIIAEVNFNRVENERAIYRLRRESLANLGIPKEILEKLSNKLIDELLGELEGFIHKSI